MSAATPTGPASLASSTLATTSPLLHHLPPETLGQVLWHLDDPASLLATSHVCRRLRRLALDDASLWRRHYLALWTRERQTDGAVARWRRRRWLHMLRDAVSTTTGHQASDHRVSPPPTPSTPPFICGARHGGGRRAGGGGECDGGGDDCDDDDVAVDWHAEFLYRLRLDQRALRGLLEQVEAPDAHAARTAAMGGELGADAKDLLWHLIAAATAAAASSSAPLEKERDSGSRREGRGVAHARVDALSFRNGAQTGGGRMGGRDGSLLCGRELCLLHHARQLLDHIQMREALDGFVTLRNEEEEEEQQLPTLHQQSRPRSEGTGRRGESRRYQRAGGGLFPSRLPRLASTRGADFERALGLLGLFVGGEPDELARELDMLAVACHLRLQAEEEERQRWQQQQKRLSSSSEVPPAAAVEEYPRMDLKRKVESICAYMRSVGLKASTPTSYHRLSNNFLHLVLARRDRSSLPLTLVAILCGIASRLGIPASPCNTPGKVVAMVSWPPLEQVETGDEERDGGRDDEEEAEEAEEPGDGAGAGTQRHGEIHLLCDPFEDGRTVPIDDARISRTLAPPASLVLRSSRNLMNSIRMVMQGVQFENDFDDEESTGRDANKAREASLAHVLRRDGVAASLVESWLATRRGERTLPRARSAAGQALQLACIYASTCASAYLDASTLEPGMEQGFGGIVMRQLLESVRDVYRADAAIHIELIARLAPSGYDCGTLTRRLEEALRGDDEHALRPKRRASSAKGPAYKVGTVFRHRRYGYAGVAYGWDLSCEAGDTWIAANLVDMLPGGGREQPFYNAFVGDGSIRYVAELNIDPFPVDELTAEERAEFVQVRGLGEWVSGWAPTEDGRMRPTAKAIATYPDDA